MSHSIAGVEFGGPVARLKCITNGIVVGVPSEIIRKIAIQGMRDFAAKIFG